MNSKMLRNKIAGAVFGFAIGDAMGATTEFMTAHQIKLKHGSVTNIIGGGWLNLEAGEVTDDTQMTMCVMDALMKYPKDSLGFEYCCAENFVKWFRKGPKDIGGQCAKGIRYIINGLKVREDNEALGNGSLMRALPCALLNSADFNIYQGKLTHNNKHCSNIIIAYTELLQYYLYNNYNNKYSNNIKKLLEPTGHIDNTFNNSVYWSQFNSFEEAIIGAVNDGGDADTIAAITGSLAGAKFGFDSIPKRWIDQLNSETKIYLKKFINFVFTYLQI